MVKDLVHRALTRIAPATYPELRARRIRAYNARLEAEYGYVGITRRLASACGLQATSGPFKGLHFPDELMGRHMGPKILGTYEMELRGAIEDAIARRPRQVIDVGSAEGYYAVGLALRCPDARVFAFDTDSWARSLTAETARINRAENVSVLGACTPAWLAENLAPGALVLSDCEGYEAVLLDPNTAPVLRSCDILVELHEAFAPGVTQALRDRFDATHDIRVIQAEPRTPPTLEGFTESERALATCELRAADQKWFYCQPRAAMPTR